MYCRIRVIKDLKYIRNEDISSVWVLRIWTMHISWIKRNWIHSKYLKQWTRNYFYKKPALSNIEGPGVLQVLHKIDPAQEDHERGGGTGHTHRDHCPRLEPMHLLLLKHDWECSCIHSGLKTTGATKDTSPWTAGLTKDLPPLLFPSSL